MAESKALGLLQNCPVDEYHYATKSMSTSKRCVTTIVGLTLAVFLHRDDRVMKKLHASCHHEFGGAWDLANPSGSATAYRSDF